MVARVIAICIGALLGTAIVTALLGEGWRFVTIRAQRPRRPLPLRERIAVRKPGAADLAAKHDRLPRVDVPCAALFLAGSIILLATPGIAGLWPVTFALWAAAAAVRWLTPGPATPTIRGVITGLLAIEGVLVLGIRGGDALLQAFVYWAAAACCGTILYRARQSAFVFTRPTPTPAPSGPRPGSRRMPAPASFRHTLADTLPAMQPAARPLAQVTPISVARRNPQRVRPDESQVISPPHYPDHVTGTETYAD